MVVGRERRVVAGEMLVPDVLRERVARDEIIVEVRVSELVVIPRAVEVPRVLVHVGDRLRVGAVGELDAHGSHDVGLVLEPVEHRELAGSQAGEEVTVHPASVLVSSDGGVDAIPNAVAMEPANARRRARWDATEERRENLGRHERPVHEPRHRDEAETQP